MYPRVSSKHSIVRIGLSLTISASLLLLPDGPLLVGDAAQSRGSGLLKAGKPQGELPNLEEVQNESQIEREPVGPVPSTVRSPKAPSEYFDYNLGQ